MKHIASIIACLSIVLISVGCQETHQVNRSASAVQAEKDFEKTLQDAITASERFLTPYRTNGLVIFKIKPKGAAIYINDGEIGFNVSRLLIPAGTYHMRAVWPNGSSVEKKVFVLPALQEPPSYNWKFERSAWKGKSSIDFNAPLHKTEIVLNKPE